MLGPCWSAPAERRPRLRLLIQTTVAAKAIISVGAPRTGKRRPVLLFPEATDPDFAGCDEGGWAVGDCEKVVDSSG